MSTQTPAPAPAPTPAPTPAPAQDPFAGRTVLITGANRGLGEALVGQVLSRGARRVYAGTRRPFTHRDERVTPVPLDVTDRTQIEAAARGIEALDVLINNAGVSIFSGLSDRQALEQQFAVNLYGPYDVAQAFLPLLAEARGTVVNVLSLAAVAPVPMSPAYSVSKAAALSLTQAMRMLLSGQGVRVHAVLMGPVDTDMARDLDIPKTAPADAAHAILDGVAAGIDDILPDPWSARALGETWPTGPVKMLEREMAGLLTAAR
jgi:NAD(P)-dependent dehydrogenase (short-subunit alcohol dehydrogenase family)